MLREIAGIERVQKLYIQLLYRCNFNCQHCFHGEKLEWKESFAIEEVKMLISTFKDEYGVSCVTFLGGEPFLYRHIAEAIRYAKDMRLRVEICTNGYKIGRGLRNSASQIDTLRVSLEGLERINDEIRHQGSFDAALKTLDLAHMLGVSTSVTMTVTAKNINEVIPLAHVVASHGVKTLKLHALRPTGNALLHPDLIITDDYSYEMFHKQLAEEHHHLPIAILLDDDLDPHNKIVGRGGNVREELERVEVQPGGELYVSCKAVGSDSHAFFYNKATGQILYRPHGKDELKRGTPQVRYSRV